MSRNAILTALVLALLTGIVLGQLRGLRAPVSTTISASNPLGLVAAETFYAGINELLATGNPDALRPIADDAYVEHGVPPYPDSLASLEEYLLGVRNVFPRARYVATDTIAQGDLVISRLAIDGPLESDSTGAPLASTGHSPGFDVLRVERGRIIERWPSAAQPAPASIETVDFPVLLENAIVPQAARLERLTIDPHGRYASELHGGTMLLIESGEVEVHQQSAYASASYLVPAARSAADFTISGTHVAGETVAIPATMSFRVANTGATNASVLALTIVLLSNNAPMVTAEWDVDPGIGMSRTLLVSGVPVPDSIAEIGLRLHQIALGPGAEIPRHLVTGGELLLVIEGRAEVFMHAGHAGVVTEQGMVSRRDGVIPLAAGQGLGANEESELACRAIGETGALLLLVTIEPATAS
jgi:hypothetical protein